jgi:hypothetical protein
MRHQELLFTASVLGAAIALNGVAIPEICAWDRDFAIASANKTGLQTQHVREGS